VLVTIVIAIRQGRTPLETVAPSLDRQLVALARRLPLWRGRGKGRGESS
jgi:hypothetical protein